MESGIWAWIGAKSSWALCGFDLDSISVAVNIPLRSRTLGAWDIRYRDSHVGKEIVS